MQHFFKNPRPAVTLSAPAPTAHTSLHSPLGALRALCGESLLPVQRRQHVDEVVDLLFEGEIGIETRSSPSLPLTRMRCSSTDGP